MTEGTQTPGTDAEALSAEPLVEITLRVNDVLHTAAAPTRRLLSDFLRHELRLTGTHVGCEHGVCGACTVGLDGVAVRSCLMFAAQLDGHELLTVEGLAADGALTPLQDAFREQHALQCGFCTPGMLMTGRALLDANPDPTELEIRTAISGGICRCTGYKNIVAAVRWAAEHEATTRQEA